MMRLTPDNFSVFLAIGLAAVSAVFHAIAAAQRELRPPGDAATQQELRPPDIARWARVCGYGSAASFSYAVVYLLSQILSGARYDLSYVFRHTSPTDPFLYRVSALWAGQEGSMLLWIAMCAWAAVLIAARPKDRSSLPAVFLWTAVAVLGWVLIISDPFARFPEFRPGMVGSGLNPLLRNPWVAIHPPIVFLGYVGLMAPAAFAIDAMLRGKHDRWIQAALPWAVTGWTLLGAGIAMGMVWSYEVLGWGGYWGWDPVENASLIPWLLSGALIHGMIVQRRTGRLEFANRALAVCTFLSVVYAAYLTRSGVLSELSVHSFGEGGAYDYWNGMMAGTAALLAGVTVIRWRGPSDSQPKKTSVSDKLVVLGIVGLVLFAAAVFVGTSLPLVTKALVQPRFYNHLLGPIAALAVVLMALVLFTRRKMTWASHISHAGVALLAIGVVFSSSARSVSVDLTKGGAAGSVFDYSLSYKGRRADGPGREVAEFRVSGRGQTFTAPIVMEYTEHEAVRRPYVRAGVLSDLYVSPVEIGDRTVRPTASVTQDGWISIPAEIPGTKSRLTLVGMQVEQDMAKLRYQPESGPAIDVEAVKDKPVSAGGVTFEVRQLLVSSAKDLSSVTAGADVALSGPGIPDLAVVQVSVKPLISLVWLGLCLVALGGGMAAWRRIRQVASEESWATIR
jgi:cytochrome c biogenesis factor